MPFWYTPIQSKRNHPILISILILSPHLRTGFTSDLFFQGVSCQNLISISDITPACRMHHILQPLSIYHLSSVLYIKTMKHLITHVPPSFPAGPNIPLHLLPNSLSIWQRINMNTKHHAPAEKQSVHVVRVFIFMFSDSRATNSAFRRICFQFC